jgi:hypothetical protein
MFRTDKQRGGLNLLAGNWPDSRESRGGAFLKVMSRQRFFLCLLRYTLPSKLHIQGSDACLVWQFTGQGFTGRSYLQYLELAFFCGQNCKVPVILWFWTFRGISIDALVLHRVVQNSTNTKSASIGIWQHVLETHNLIYLLQRERKMHRSPTICTPNHAYPIIFSLRS